MPQEVEPRFHHSREDQAFKDLMAPEDERHLRQKAGREFRDAIDQVVNPDHFAYRYLFFGETQKHLTRRKRAAHEIKRMRPVRKAIQADLESHFEILREIFESDNPKGEVGEEGGSTQEMIDVPVDLEDLSNLREEERDEDWLRRVADTIDSHVKVREEEELYDDRLGNIYEFIDYALQNRNLAIGNLLLGKEINSIRDLNDFFSYILMRLNVPPNLQDQMYLNDPDLAEKRYHREFSEFKVSPQGKHMFISRAHSINEMQLAQASYYDLSRGVYGDTLNPEVTYFVTLYDYIPLPGSPDPTNEVTYQLSADTKEVEFYFGAPIHPAAHYFSQSMDSKSRASYDSYLRRVPLESSRVEELIEKIRQST